MPLKDNHLYLAKANDKLVSHCRCADAGAVLARPLMGPTLVVYGNLVTLAAFGTHRRPSHVGAHGARVRAKPACAIDAGTGRDWIVEV